METCGTANNCFELPNLKRRHSPPTIREISKNPCLKVRDEFSESHCQTASDTVDGAVAAAVMGQDKMESYAARHQFRTMQSGEFERQFFKINSCILHVLKPY